MLFIILDDVPEVLVNIHALHQLQHIVQTLILSKWTKNECKVELQAGRNGEYLS